jgi:uncharacterized protein YbcI
MGEASGEIDSRAARGRQLASISNAMVRLYADLYGRGPTRAKTVWHDDVLAVVLEDVYTPTERTLIDAGHADRVRETRRLFQQATRERFVAPIEELTGRSVRCVLSQSDVDPDVCVETFLLDPQG